MMHKAWSSIEEVPYCFSRSYVKLQGHTAQNITDFDPNWAFPDYRPVAAFKSLRFALLYIYLYGLSLNGWHTLFRIVNNRHGVTITRHAIKRHFLIWMTTVRQPAKHWCSCVLTFKFDFICVYWWTRQRIHNTLIVVDQYLQLMGDKTIPDSAEPRLESFYPPFVAGIDLPHQGVVDSYNL